MIEGLRNRAKKKGREKEVGEGSRIEQNSVVKNVGNEVVKGRR